MKKILFVLLMVLSLVISLPAQAEEIPIASFDFDTKPEDGWTSYAGTGAVANKIGDPQWMSDFKDRTGVIFFDGDDGLQLFGANGVSSLLKGYTKLTISFEYLDATNWYPNPDGAAGRDRYLFYAAKNTDDGNGLADDFVYAITNTNSDLKVYSPIAANNPNNHTPADWNSMVSTNVGGQEKWVPAKIELTFDSAIISIDGQIKSELTGRAILTDILGAEPVFYLGTNNESNGLYGYLDNIVITGSTEAPPKEAALNPFNNLGNDRPNLYGNENKTLTLKVQGSDSSLERIVFPVEEGAKITLPSEASLRAGFTIGDTTYVLDGELENPRKLIGWYNLADGKYYSVLKGDAKNVTLTGNNDVFYGDWIASSYDFLGGNTDGLITTADTSDFIDINVFDYSELVNVNSMTVSQSGVGSESWSVYDNRANGWLAFSDYGTYQSTGSIGFPNDRENGSANGYNEQKANQGLLYLPDPNDNSKRIFNQLLLDTMFNQNSRPGTAGYVPGINYLGKGNFLFSYDPATGMYSYDCDGDEAANIPGNAAVYQQNVKEPDKGRFYVYNTPFEYHSTDASGNWIVCHDFFPLNFKADNEEFKLNKENGVPNYWFGMDFTMDFFLPDNSGIFKDEKPVSNQITQANGETTNMIFEFEGDDDMWVLIDGELVLDIGGIHDPVEGTIDFSTGKVEVFYKDDSDNKIVLSSNELKFSAGDHTMKIYYLERGGDKSNCTIKFNLLPEYEVKQPGIDTVKIVKKWENVPTGFKLPADLTVELYDGDNRIKTATLTQDNNWSHSFSNLTPAQSKDGYSVKEPSPGDDFLVNVIPDSEVYDIAWVFTDMAGLADGKEIVIGDSKGHVLGADLNAHDVEIDEVFNIITKIADNEAAEKALKWTVNLAEAYTGGKHFYLKNGEKYLCISSGTDGIHLHDTKAQASVFYLNASGDLQDATTGHRLIATDDDKHFGVATNKGGNVTIESAEKATLYVKRESKTTAYSFIITNTYVDPTVPMGTLQISKTISGNAADKNDQFTFTVTLTDKDGKPVSGTFDTHTFVDGKCSFTLKGNESENFADLPIGVTYTVTEEPTAGYVQTAPTEPATGVIYTEPSIVSFTNVRDVVRLVKVTDPTGLTVAPKVTISGSDGSVVTTEALTANNAAKYLEIPVKPGVTYTVAESGADIPGYAFVGSHLTAKDTEVTVSGMTFTASKSGMTTIPVLTLTNTYAQGGLTVKKTIGGNASDENDVFTFTVTLTDKDGKPVSGTFDTHTFVDGKYSFTLKDGESKNFADLPIGVTYTVTETPALGYIQTAPTAPATGVISTEPSVVSFTNERWAVDIEKKAVGLNGTDTVAPKVTVGDVVIDELPADGKTTERIFVTPGKAYAVAEENAEVPGYTLVSATLTTEASDLTIKDMGFTLSADSTTIPVLTLTNTYVQGGLTVKKTIGGNAADENDVFTFLVTLTDKDGKAVSGTFDTHTFVDGKYSFTLKDGESENFADLPIGVTYTVTEEPTAGYVQTAPTAPATGVISTEPSVVSFTNVRDVVRLVKVTDPTGLTVTPKVTVTGSDGSVVTTEALTANNAAKYLEIPVKPGVTYTVAESGQEVAGYTFAGSKLTAKDAEVAVSGMTFTASKSGLTTIPVLTLTNSYTLDSVTVTIRKVSTGLTEGIAYPAPKVSIYAANSTAPVWTGTLTPNGSALPVKLLPGTYSVKEAIDEVEGYGFTSVLYVNDAASADKTFTLAANAVNTELRLDNFYAAEFSTLTLTKTVKGESGSKTGFSFRITLTDDAGKPITERFPYTGTMDGAAPLNGVITSGSTVALRDGGSITVQLPLGVHYEVEEQEQEGYVLVSSEGEKGVIEKGGAKAAFVNKPQYTATVTKVWEGDTADVRPASVQVQLMLNGKPVGDPVTLNAANGWKHTYTGLDTKGPYTVDELTVAEGYVSAVEEGEGNTFVITNSYIVIPPTGDAAHPALYLLALAGSAALLILLRKRKAA